jgi:hypothetical protein
MKRLTTALGILGVFSVFGVSTAFAQDDPEPATAKPVTVQMPDGSVKQGYAVSTAEPKPVPKQIAFTANPLNFIIGRYGFNFEYQPVLHHGLILTPHYDSVNADVTGVCSGTNGTLSTCTYKDSFSGFGGELGYRFYTGDKGFNGFFVSPQFLLAAYKSHGEGLIGTAQDVSFTSLGWALDFGGQAQIGSFIIGGGGGFQYTKISKDFTDLPFAAAVVAGGGWRPRVLLNIGFAL